MGVRPKTIAIIPARMGSTRLPDKPLIKVRGKPIIQYVWENCISPLIDFKIVATDDHRILEVVKNFGGEVMMSHPNHPNGSSRCAEVIEKFPDYEWIINVQGDEPMVNEKVIHALLHPFQRLAKTEVTTLKAPISHDEAGNPNVVKVVTDEQGYALYFSRAQIPYSRNQRTKPLYYKHLGFYAFRRKSLLEYVQMPPSSLENIEQLEQLRLVEARKPIYVSEYHGELIDINTEKDLKKFRERLGIT